MTNVRAKISSNDVARKALRILVVRKLDPTPDNYRILYNEIAGLDPEAECPSAAEVSNRIVADFLPMPGSTRTISRTCPSRSAQPTT